jgi:microcystin-dependent protein
LTPVNGQFNFVTYHNLIAVKSFIISTLLLISSSAIAQSVAINNDASLPHPSSMLDVKSNARGVLVPRVALTNRNVAAPVISPTNSLLVYNTATAGTGVNSVVPGFYYWNSTSWIPIGQTTNAAITGKNHFLVQDSTGQTGTKKGYGAQAINYIIATSGIYPCRSDCTGYNYDYTIMGEIKLFAGDFAPAGWALCNGQLLSINQNQALFSLLLFNYGGNGVTTFALPDLRSAVPLHFGASTTGQSWNIGEKKD